MFRNDCANMTQQCLSLFGFLCMMNGILELITLLTFVGGRAERHTSPVAGKQGVHGAGGATSTSYKYMVTIDKRPFFDGPSGFQYNLQSAMMIASPSSELLGAFLCYQAYNTYTSSMFA